MTGASIETTLELWASSLREVKRRMRPLFKQDRVVRSAEHAKMRRTSVSSPISRVPLSAQDSVHHRVRVGVRADDLALRFKSQAAV